MICPIVELIVESFERKDDMIMYPVKVKLYTSQIVELKYQYSEFIQFSKLLHQEHQYLKKHQLPKLSKKKFYASFKNQQKHVDRQAEVELFCKQLLQLPSSIKCSNLFLSFFITKQKKQYKPTISTSIKRTFSLKNNINATNSIKKSDIIVIQEESQEKILLQDEQIKFKVIYDKNNIIVIRVPKSITFDQLKSRVMQKFAALNIDIPNQLAFRVIDKYTVPTHNNARYSIMSTSTISTTSTIDSYNHILSPTDLLLAEDQDLSKAMKEKWFLHQKVILQCII